MNKKLISKQTFAILGVLLFVVLAVFVSVLFPSLFASGEVRIEQNGPRVIVHSADSSATYQWQVREEGESFGDVPGATGKYYDISVADKGRYIRALVNGVATEEVGPIGKLIVFDLSEASVSIGASYSGKNSEGADVSGTHENTNIYLIQQSDVSKYSKNKISVPGNNAELSFDITIDGIHLGSEPVKNKTPDAQGIGGYDYGAIDLQPGSGVGSKSVVLRIKGENIVRAIHYYAKNVPGVADASKASLKITDINGDGASDGGSLYLPIKLAPDKIEDFVKNGDSYNHWNSAIGGDDSSGDAVNNFEIAGGYIQALTTYTDNCTAIGAGGNGPCTMKISGGTVVAHCSGTGAAIGGGIGWHSAGGTSNVTITGGNIYAKNHGKIFVKATYNADGSISTTKIVEETDEYNEIIGGVAIGSGSSVKSSGSKGTVTITGGTVKAYGTYGNGIGGGNSSSSAGGEATIKITGGIVEASSIGGGDSKNKVGGAATVDIGTVDVGGTAQVTLIKGIGGGSSMSGNGGEATIKVYGGTMNAAGSIGGGAGGGTGNGGVARVYIHGGNLTAASIGGGVGGDSGNGGAAEIYVYEGDGVIETGSIGGGDTLNPTGKLGYAKAEIRGGNISGQFLMAAGGTQPCSFTMTGGTLHGVNTADTSKFKYARLDGAAVYMGDPNGIVSISGGTVRECVAQNGGAIYMSAGTCTISDAAIIESCVATQNGGAIYMGGGKLEIKGGTIRGNSAQNGGAAFVNGGDVFVYDGSVSSNTAAINGGGVAVNNGNYSMVGGNVENNTATSGNGGGIYVAADGKDVKVGIYSGSVSGNKAGKNGGALSVVGEQSGTEVIAVQIGVDFDHNFDSEGNPRCDHDYTNITDVTVESCPQVNGNKASVSGGAVFVTGNNERTTLNVFCLTEDPNNLNSADGDLGADKNSQSNFMKVEGGKVTITTSDKEIQADQDAKHGNTHIFSTVYVTGGQMELWGEMTNPSIADVITVDITKEGDDFDDYRKNNGAKKYYKLRYYENFKDPITGLIKGQYKQYDILHGENRVILGNIYSHPGYTIIGWNTADQWNNALVPYYPQEVTPSEPSSPRHPDDASKEEKITGWYKIGSDYLFNDDPIGDLTIYAIWDANCYFVSFDPNADSYSGTMTMQEIYYGNQTALKKNDFSRKGYEFIGWCEDKVPTATSKIYADEEVLTTDLTTEKGAVVPLYAQWRACDHNPDTHTYTYHVIETSSQDKILRRECSCGAYYEDARLVAEDTVYDRTAHPATVVYSSDWNPSVVYEAKEGDALEAGEPYHAGKYEASISGGGVTATVTFVIKKAPQNAPPVPVYEEPAAGTNTIYIKPVADSPNKDEGSVPQYRVVYYEDGVLKETEWLDGLDTLIDGQYAAAITLTNALTNYYVQARYSECDNYLASPESVGDRYFHYGDVTFVVNDPNGVTVEVIFAKKDVNGSEELDGITVKISAESGFYFPKGYHAKITTTAGNPDLTPFNTFSNEYKITNIPTECTIKMELPDAAKALTIQSQISEKQIFGALPSDSAVISRDSAYTVRFDVSFFTKVEYQIPVLSFSTLPENAPALLPENTTIILQDKQNAAYYYHNVGASGLSTISLTEFLRMGTKDIKFVPGEAMQLQFVVDFSKTDAGVETIENLVTTLYSERQSGSLAAEKTERNESAEVKDVDLYSLNRADTTEGLLFTHTYSQGVASKWDGRDNAIIFSTTAVLPKDARLSVSCGRDTIVIYPNCDGNFVYAVPDLDQGIIQVKLLSDLLNENATFEFDAKLVSARSKAEQSAKNGERLAESEEFNVRFEKEIPVSLKIVVADDVKLFKNGGSVEMTLHWMNLQSQTHSLKLTLMRKSENGEYSGTGVAKDIYFDKEEGNSANVTFSLVGLPSGSFRIVATAEKGSITVAEAVYYFVVE